MRYLLPILARFDAAVDAILEDEDARADAALVAVVVLLALGCVLGVFKE